MFALGLLLTSGSLLALHRRPPDAVQALELAVLVAANLVATVLRFVALALGLPARDTHHEGVDVR